ncbi:hypothetical protein CkaCkLH20_00970 [Colletotrichum karsti]|uniref:Clr5 domain-containing protein n=1 Tax=Colletotrichum karsti TaxID=1095194 RepID=A0A9P6IFD4_9PEZI|nr:uncharacterized protein CkaCkLH20_00970 [Colletotrichum karsti]KAF9881824.1 hypothetical protein CkaCkLH20_00970 [Colletotrichum karsti]
MSPRDWEAKKEIIRRLYLIENLPLKELIDMMRRMHGFHATERMYKRQFVKWGWKKYNTKGLQDGLVERPPGKATCRRPPRGRMIRFSASNIDILYFASNMPVMLNHGSNLDRMKHAILTSQRDLIYGTLRRDPEWTTRDRLNICKTSGDLVIETTWVANNLFMVGDLQKAGAVFRQVFRSLETVIDDEPITFFEPLLLDMPYHIKDYELRVAYLRHLWQLLDLKRPGEPVTLIAAMMSKLEAEEDKYFYHTTEEMHRVKRDLYIEALGEDDLRSIHSERELLGVEDHNDDSLRRCERIFRNYELLLARTIDQFGQFSAEAFDVELKQIAAASLLAPLFGLAMGLYDKYLDRVRSATGDKSIDEWEHAVLDQYSNINYRIGSFQTKSGNVEAGITAFNKSITAALYAMATVNDESIRLDYACDILYTRYELVEALDKCGRNGEADEVRAAIASSEYLEAVMQDDLGENFEEYVSLLC